MAHPCPTPPAWTRIRPWYIPWIPEKDPSSRSFVLISMKEPNGPPTVHGPRMADAPYGRAPSPGRTFAAALRHETCELDGACMTRERASIHFHGCDVRRVAARTVQPQLQPCFFPLCTLPFRPFSTLPRAPRDLVLRHASILSRARGIDASQRRQSRARLRIATNHRLSAPRPRHRRVSASTSSPPPPPFATASGASGIRLTTDVGHGARPPRARHALHFAATEGFRLSTRQPVLVQEGGQETFQPRASPVRISRLRNQRQRCGAGGIRHPRTQRTQAARRHQVGLLFPHWSLHGRGGLFCQLGRREHRRCKVSQDTRLLERQQERGGFRGLCRSQHRVRAGCGPGGHALRPVSRWVWHT
mmetsp:Transcript_3768/g.23756  ORF Transcript_3768/g.23756 Transcript_3768/m.23756 type:complete len:360 (+) Transcript_3768:720-1799(+)